MVVPVCDSVSESLLHKLELFRKTLRSSELLQQTVQLITLDCTPAINYIRCLALGSPSESTAALYQLAYVLELSESLNIPTENISHYDPVFTREDTLLLESLGSVVEQVYQDKHQLSTTTLYFLPHAGLDLTNTLIETHRPTYLLANNLITHTDRISKQKLHQQYVQLSLLANLVQPATVSPVAVLDGFTVARKLRRKRNAYQPPKIDYDYSNVYFSDINLKPLDNLQGPWVNAFTDLTLHTIQLKEQDLTT